MKRIYLLMVIVVISTICSAQGIYTKITKYDKFDDVVWTKKIKTLITKTDSSIVIETKGQKPVEYRYLDNPLFVIHDGRPDSLSNLTANVYGYESQYSVCTKEMADKFIKEVNREMEKLSDSQRTEFIGSLELSTLISKQIKKMPSITFRTISAYSHVFTYDTDLAWIRYEDGSRVIYTKE